MEDMLKWPVWEQSVQTIMAREHIPGLAVAVVKDDALLYAQGFGVTSVEDGGLPVTPQTLFQIGSITKMLTGTALMQLVETNILNLDRPLHEYLNWLSLDGSYTIKQMTLRQLMSHTSGLPNDSIAGSHELDGLEKYIRNILPTYHLVAPPGEVYSYSNPGVNLAGYLGQMVSGKFFPELIHDLVFMPLEMSRSTFDPRVAMTYPTALPHILHENTTLRVLHRIEESTAYNPCGYAWSTVLDLSNLARMYLQNGIFNGRTLLDTHTIAEMHHPHADKYTVTQTQYGLLCELFVHKGMHCIGHNGVMSTFGSHLLLIPEANLACILMINRIPRKATELILSLLDFLLDLPEAKQIVSFPISDTTQWPHYIGSYIGNRTGLAEIELENNQLQLHFNQQTIALQPQRPGIYYGYRTGNPVPLSVGFVRNEHGETPYLLIDGAAHIRYNRDPSFSWNPDTWQIYCGKYEYKNAGQYEWIIIWLDKGTLFLRYRDQKNEDAQEEQCIPIEKNRCVWSHGLIEFHTANNGSISHLIAMNVYKFEHVHLSEYV